MQAVDGRAPTGTSVAPLRSTHAGWRAWLAALVVALLALARCAVRVSRAGWRWTRRGAVVVWRALRPYGTASWRHPPRGA
jgi:hypothetical protein